MSQVPPLFVTVALLTLVTPLWTQAGAGLAGEGIGDAIALLSTLAKDAGPSELERQARALAELADAPDLFLAVASTRMIPGRDGAEPEPVGAHQLGVLLRAAPWFSRAQVARAVQQSTERDATRTWRLAALHLLDLHGMVTEVSLARRVALGEPTRPEEDPELRNAFQSALTQMIRRDPRSLEALSRLPVSPPGLRKAMCRAVGGAGNGEGIEWLSGLLDDPAVASVALQEIGRLAPEAPRESVLRVAMRIRPFLRRSDPGPRKHAIRVLADLHDAASVPDLIEILEVGTPGERKAAWSALRKMSGRQLPDRNSIWRSWFEEQQRWLREEGIVAIAGLGSEREADLVRAIGTLSERVLYRDFVVPELVPLLDAHDSPTIRAQVCLALGRLGSQQAVPALRVALDDPEEPVREAASQALRSLLGAPNDENLGRRVPVAVRRPPGR